MIEEVDALVNTVENTVVKLDNSEEWNAFKPSYNSLEMNSPLGCVRNSYQLGAGRRGV